VAEIPFSRFAVGGFAVRLVMVVQQCGDLWISHENDVTTVATIAAIGATEWFELFPANGGFPMSTIARGGMHGHMINELGHLGPPGFLGVKTQSGDGPGRSAPAGALDKNERYWAAVGTMSTTLRPRRLPNATAPASRAKRVWSFPTPTLRPGWYLVPRWRTKISPALTSWPP